MAGAGAIAGVDRRALAALAGQYQRQWPVRMCAVEPGGRRLATMRWWSGRDDASQRAVLAFALEEALRWGEPTVSYAPQQRLYWAVPLMHNASVLGGLVAGMTESELFPGAGGGSSPALDLRVACTALRELVERHNLTNAAYLQQQRAEYRREQERAEALHTIKRDPHSNIRRVFLDEEPRLLAAVRRGDRAAARAALNRVLMIGLGVAGERFELMRSVLIEIVAALCRTAVEAGGDAEELLGARFNAISELAQYQSLELMSPRLHWLLERMMDAIDRGAADTSGIVMSDALTFMREHLHEPLSRDAVAEAMCLSPSHFSRQFRRHVGRSFTDVLTRMRLERAAHLLTHTTLSVRQAADASGFSDAGYFTRVFGKVMGQTPRQYRRQHQAPVGGGD